MVYYHACSADRCGRRLGHFRPKDADGVDMRAGSHVAIIEDGRRRRGSRANDRRVLQRGGGGCSPLDTDAQPPLHLHGEAVGEFRPGIEHPRPPDVPDATDGLQLHAGL